MRFRCVIRGYSQRFENKAQHQQLRFLCAHMRVDDQQWCAITHSVYSSSPGMDQSDIILVVLVSVASVVGVFLLMLLCSWCCCRRRPSLEEEEETLARSVRSLELGSDAGSDVRSVGKSGGLDRNPATGRKTIRFVTHMFHNCQSSVALHGATTIIIPVNLMRKWTIFQRIVSGKTAWCIWQESKPGVLPDRDII